MWTTILVLRRQMAEEAAQALRQAGILVKVEGAGATCQQVAVPEHEAEEALAVLAERG